MDRRRFLKLASLGAVAFSFGFSRSPDDEKPNLVYILADDLGYGDVSCLNEESRLHTVHIDRLARDGMVFTDAHAGSAVCTPTRYGILTGRYCWRTWKKHGVLSGYSPHLIDPKRLTVASMLKQMGYKTAAIGKWHLGWDWQKKGPGPRSVDFTKPIKNGPTSVGFDYFFGINGSLDMAPYVFVENDRVTALPNRVTHSDDRMAFWREGPTGADFEHEKVLDKLTEKAVNYIESQKKGQPFFLYFALTAPHTPILPTKPFRGKSHTNAYGDFVLQVDYTVGQILDALKRAGLEENTIVIFTSDNGCSPRADFKELARYGHHPSYVFRGHKADIFEGGHRIPFIVRWPAKVKPGSTCDDVVCLTDLMATMAEITHYKLPDNAGEDSVSILPDLLGTATKPVREAIVHHSVNGSFSIRQGKWKLELCPGSGGWSDPRPVVAVMSDLPPVQLYDLTQDISERRNLQAEYPDVVKRLTALMQSYADRGRSTPGKPQKNDTPVDIFYGPKRARELAKKRGKKGKKRKL
ncbi:MAG: arylsulfatase [Calditrichaeota bacterium]|nr:arylsulfatase [Calditrichota bacterium]